MNENLNLPTLNPGWEWRVSSTHRNDGFRVDLYRTGAREDAYNEDSEYIHSGLGGGFKPQHAVTPRDIRKAAEKILRNRAERERNRATGRGARQRFEGTH